jgi:plastocyanin
MDTLVRSARLTWALLALGLGVAAATVAHADDSTTTVTMTGYQFAPVVATVAPGVTVTWINADTVQHTVTWDDASVDSGWVDQDGLFSYTFSDSGSYGYYCVPHGTPGNGMYGTIVVADPGA